MTAWAWTSAAAGLVAAVVAWAWRRPVPVGRRWPLWLIAVAAASFVVNATIAMRRGLPEPRVHDEFSYLLAADTFAHGRLANPTPPAAAALQTFHVLVTPAYASKYPPGQGLFLAAGQATTGMPIVGAWLATAVLVVVVGWAVAGLAPPAWAVGAAVLVAFHPQVVEWSRTYWGGSVTAIGGALVLGGWARSRSSGCTRGGRVAFGVGLGVLLLTRPYEGAAFAGPFVVALGWNGAQRLRRGSFPIGRTRGGAAGLRGVAWVGLGLLPFVAFLGVYNTAVTGRPWRLPYLAWERQYAAAPPLVVEPPRPVPAGVPADLRAYAERVELPHYAAQRSVGGFASAAVGKVRYLAAATLPSPWLWVLAVAVPWAAWRDRSLAVVAFAILTTLAATLVSNWTRPQYVAPATAAVAGLAVAAGRTLGRPAWAAAVVGTAVLSFAPAVPGPRFQRATLAVQLAHEPGRQLVLVHYGPNHRPDDEWVYNDADPPSSPVVWARAGVLADATVRAAYPGRTVWHLDVTADAAAVRRE